MDSLSALQFLGLNEKEAKIYLSLLGSGKSTAYQIAKRTELKKPTVYVILEQLVKQGAVKKILKHRATQFAAEDPVDLFVTARSRVDQAETMLPQLRALAQNDSKVVQASYYEGVSGIRELYKKLAEEMEGQTVVGFFAHGKDTPKELWDYWSEFNKEMIRHRIKFKAITTIDETTKDYLNYKKVPKEFMELRGLPESMYSSNISIEIYKNRTQIVSHRYEQAILIENPDVASVLRQIFEIVWQKTEERA